MINILIYLSTLAGELHSARYTLTNEVHHSPRSFLYGFTHTTSEVVLENSLCVCFVYFF